MGDSQGSAVITREQPESAPGAGAREDDTSRGPDALKLPRRFWYRLIGLTVAVRAIVSFGILGSMPLESDSSGYSEQAAAIVAGHASHPYYWPPGTSYFLAGGYSIFGVHASVARLMTIALSVVLVVTTTLIAARLLKDRRAVMLAGLVLALSPETVLMSAEPYAQDLTLVCVNLTVLALLLAWDTGRLRWYVLTGLALGVGALTRPSTLSLLLVFAVAGVVVARRRRRAGARPGELRRLAIGAVLVVVCSVAVMFPAARHNHAAGGGWSLAVNSNVDIWLGNNPYTPNYKTWWLGQHPTSFFPPATQAYIRRFPYDFAPTQQQRSRDLAEAKRFVIAHPAVTALRTVNRARAFWGFPYTISNDVSAHWGKKKLGAALLVLEAGGYVLFGLLVIAGVVFARSMFRRERVLFAIGTVAAFELPYALVYGAGRWHYPVLGLLAPLAGAGLAWALATPRRFAVLLRSRAFVISALLFLAVQAEYAYYIRASS